MVKVNNTYDKLQEVVLGDLDKNILSLAPEEHRDKLDFIFDATIDDLNSMQKIFLIFCSIQVLFWKGGWM